MHRDRKFWADLRASSYLCSGTLQEKNLITAGQIWMEFGIGAVPVELALKLLFSVFRLKKTAMADELTCEVSRH